MPPLLPLATRLLPTHAPLVVAVSGGPDSVALLAALREVAAERAIALHVAHLDHGLRPEAVDDAAWVAHLAAEWGLPATIGAADVRAFAARSGRGIEDAARQVRYAFLAGVAWHVGAAHGIATGYRGCAAVTTAHTADDQAETVLMNIVRGTGLDGLAAMDADARWPIAPADVDAVAAHAHIDVLRSVCPWPADRPLPRLLRPLLAADRTAIAAYLAAAGIAARTDASNDDRAFLRNRVRLDIVPLLEAINPQLRAALNRLADTATDDLGFMDEAVDAAWQGAAMGGDGVVDGREGIEGIGAKGTREGDIALGTPALIALHPALRRRVLRRAFARIGGDVRELGHDHVESLLRAVEAAGEGRPTTLSLPGRIRAHADGDRLTLQRERTAIPPPRLGTDPIALIVPGETRLPGGWVVAAKVVDAAGSRGPGAEPGHEGRDRDRDPWSWSVDLDVVRAPIAVRGRLPGDRLPLDGMGTGHKRLQDIFVDAKVPAAERDGWPVVVAGATILWVPGLRGDGRFRAGVGAGRRVVLTVAPPGRIVPTT